MIDLERERRHGELMDKIASLVGVRERTVRELRQRLLSNGYEIEDVDRALESALRVGLVDDVRFARSYIRGKSNSGWGKGKIISKLREYGVSELDIESASDEFPSSDQELERALRELDRKPTHSSNPYAALMRRLVGKGYSYDIARQAVEAYLGR